MTPLQLLILFLVQAQPNAAPADTDAVLQRIPVFRHLGRPESLMHAPDLVGTRKRQLAGERRLAIGL